MKRNAFPLFLSVLCAAAVLVTGCARLAHDPVDKRYYQLLPEREAGEPGTRRDMVLKVRRLSVSDLYNTRELVYREPGGRVESDYYNMFFVTPGDMLTQELRTWLRETGLFSHIIEPGSMVVSGLTLEGVVNALYGDYTTDAPAAVVEMQFFVVDESTAANDIVFSADYRRRVPIAEPDPAALVQAMTTGVEAIFADLETDLAKAMPTP